MSTVAVDFDGVIHAYSKGWHDGTIYDEPVPGALDAIESLMERYAVAIFTTRDTEQVKDWLLGHGFDDIWTDLAWEPPFWNEAGSLLVTNRKPAAIAYIDDRGIRFESWNQALADLARLEPPKTGLDKVAEAVRRSRGGDAPVQFRGFA
jgi:hypothetical protein